LAFKPSSGCRLSLRQAIFARGFGFVFSENHASRARLQHTGHVSHDGLVHVVASAFDDDHCAVFQVANALTRFFAHLDDSHLKSFARQKDRLERIGEVVEIDHSHIVQLGNFVQVVVIRDHFAIQVLCQQHQLLVDRLTCKFGKIAIVDLHVDFWVGS